MSLFSHTQKIVFSRAGDTIESSSTITASGELCEDVVFAADASAQVIAMDLEWDAIKSVELALQSSTEGAPAAGQSITVNVNAGGSADESFTLTTDKPAIAWKYGDSAYSPLGPADITQLMLTNNGSPAAAGLLKIRILFDSGVAPD